MDRKLSLGTVMVALAAAFGGTAGAQTLPGGPQSGASSQSSGALVTISIPSVIGVDVGHNFVLDFSSGTQCWGAGSTQGTFPQAASGTTTYNFAVTATAYDPASQNVACPASGSQAAVASVQVFSSSTVNSHLQAGIVNGGQGASSVAFTALIADIFSASRLVLTKASGTCGGGSGTSHIMTVAASDYITAIPKTGWSDCSQTLSLTLLPGTPVAAGTATGTLTFTIINP